MSHSLWVDSVHGENGKHLTLHMLVINFNVLDNDSVVAVLVNT